MRPREFQFSDKDFDWVRKEVKRLTGISMSEGKRDLIYNRLSRRLRATGIAEFKQYCELVKSGDRDEKTAFINALTTNLTSFFRESHHFDFLVKTALPEAMARNRSTKRIRIWSAGCSSGQEPYSIAISIRNFFPELLNWDVKILATDLDTDILAKAQGGVYDDKQVESVDKHRITGAFKKGSGDNDGLIRIDPELQALITFKQLNLMDAWPMKGPFDMIFCRNVIIYFDDETRNKLLGRYADLIVPEGYLFLGHSETIVTPQPSLKMTGQTVYHKVA